MIKFAMINFGPAAVSDAGEIAALMHHYFQKKLVLDRDETEIAEHIHTFRIARDNSKIVGCCALWEYNPSVAEVRSLAVAESFQGKGLGRRLMEQIVELAKAKKYETLFTLTQEVAFFEHFGFHPVEKETLPEKIWKDCQFCWNKDDCNETAMSLKLSP